MSRLRTAAALLALALAVGGVLSGCGQGATTHTLPAQGPVTKAAAIEFAHAVNLTPAAVPGFVSVSLEKESKPERSDAEEARCTGGPSPKHTVVAITSPRFRRGQGLHLNTVQSGVTVWPTAAMAARSLGAVQAAVREARARACLLRLTTRGFAKGFGRSLSRRISFTIGRVAFSRLPDPVSHGVGFRLIVPLSFARAGGPRFHTRFYVDALALLSGPAEISLETSGLSSPVPAATERQLIAGLASRAGA
jgi:hypothetical protein